MTGFINAHLSLCLLAEIGQLEMKDEENYKVEVFISLALSQMRFYGLPEFLFQKLRVLVNTPSRAVSVSPDFCNYNLPCLLRSRDVSSLLLLLYKVL